MVTIDNFTTNQFKLEGIAYFKNFLPHVVGNNVRIVNNFDTKFALVEFTPYDEFTVNGSTYGSVEALQIALLPVLFTRESLGGAGNGIWGSITGNIEDQTDLIDYVASLNAGVENYYADHLELFAGVGNQTNKRIQFVADASAHPDITSGYAYFEYLGTTTSTFSDYRLLTDIEVSLVETNGVRRQKVIDIVDNTSAPPTEALGDRYIIDNTGSSHADWDGASANDIVEFNGTSWIFTSPSEGWNVYVDDKDKDYRFVDDGTPQWEVVAAGSGDMLKSVYDPTNQNEDAFSMDNMIETGTKKIFTDTERTKLASLVALGNVASGSIATTFTLDHNNKFWNTKTMTADTTFSDSNLAVDGVTRGMYLTGNFVPTFPAYWTADADSQTYNGTVLCRITWDVLNATASSEDVRYFIKVIE